MISKFGCKVKLAATGISTNAIMYRNNSCVLYTEACEAAFAEIFDIILMDIHM